jgi:dihydrofolate reductase
MTGPEGGGPKVVMVAAYADNRVIGRDGDMPWHLSEDLKHFRETTRGHTVVMGRVTYEGIAQAGLERRGRAGRRLARGGAADRP